MIITGIPVEVGEVGVREQAKEVGDAAGAPGRPLYPGHRD